VWECSTEYTYPCPAQGPSSIAIRLTPCDTGAARKAARSVLLCGECPCRVFDMVDSKALNPSSRWPSIPPRG
jgi:hypothetical protein